MKDLPFLFFASVRIVVVGTTSAERRCSALVVGSSATAVVACLIQPALWASCV